MIQALIPLGLEAVEQALLQEITTLAVPPYAHGDAHPKRVQNAGLIRKVFGRSLVPRVRSGGVSATAPRMQRAPERHPFTRA